jgi:hypothetical protein
MRYMKYELERASTIIHGIPTLAVWITNAVREHQLVGGTFDDQDVVALSIPPSIKTCSYKKIKAYGSHFCVDDQTNVGCVTYDNGVASFFSHNNVDDNHHPSRQLQYLGVAKDILQLDYGTMSTPIVLFICDWVQNASDNRGNPTYKRDDAGLLMANFRHMLSEDIEPFVFPSQVQQVFNVDDRHTPWWKVVHVEPRSRRVFFDTYGEYISTNEDDNALDAPYTMLDAPTIFNRIGAVFISRAESLLLNEARQLCVERT